MADIPSLREMGILNLMFIEIWVPAYRFPGMDNQTDNVIFQAMLVFYWTVIVYWGYGHA